ncbi:hypothetical protein QE152_g15244 [Popillia japonica]|uniref:Tyr recombinase domain-containing protein n=1 Tax=Popillia japonica TaxID=7064 RepID=A0AAW1L8W7_POPJA
MLNKYYYYYYKISAVAQELANFLKLDNWKEYTGHALRRMSVTLLVDGGGDFTCLKRHGGWRSSTVAESYIEESRLNKENIAKRILGDVDDSGSTGPSVDIISNITSENNSTIAEN